MKSRRRKCVINEFKVDIGRKIPAHDRVTSAVYSELH